MERSLELLYQRYTEALKEETELFIGIELEFPIVNCKGQATDIRVSQQLMGFLAETLNFVIEKRDRQGNPIQLSCPKTGDCLLFEVSYNILEFAFGKAKVIQEVEERFEQYLKIIQSYLRSYEHELQGWGIHPQWQQNDNRPVSSPRYEMLMHYLALSKSLDNPFLHPYPQYGAFICGSQVQLDVTKTNYLRVINAFNQIEPAKAFLFANSTFEPSEWTTNVARDLFWEESMHGIFSENVGVFPYDFQTESEFFDYLNQSAIFTAHRDGESYYFYPIQVKDYLKQDKIEAFSLTGQKTLIKPSEKDFSTHRSYQYQDLTTRGTVEFRSVCTQNFELTFSSAAFHLGLLVELEKLESLLRESFFFQRYGREYRQLRRKFAQPLDVEEQKAIVQFSKELLQLSRKGLEQRHQGEEMYLYPLFDQVGSKFEGVLYNIVAFRK
ncbi:gamma-glutamylcysteine synthetase [Streptococcus pneumoniae]